MGFNSVFKGLMFPFVDWSYLYICEYG